MGTTLRLTHEFDGLLDLSPLSAAIGADADAIAKISLTAGRCSLLAGELFEILDSPGDVLTVSGDLRRGIRIGAGLAHGAIHVLGPVGAEAGLSMRGGTLLIEGDAGDDALCAMENGFARFSGRVGSGFARSMRRGVTVVSGCCGDNACTDMLGGTALLLAGTGQNLAAGMRRGTVLLPFGSSVPMGFAKAADVDLTFLRLLFTMLRERDVPLPESWYGGTFTRYRGDPAALGKGEIFIPSEAL